MFKIFKIIHLFLLFSLLILYSINLYITLYIGNEVNSENRRFPLDFILKEIYSQYITINIFYNQSPYDIHLFNNTNLGKLKYL